MSRPSLFNRIGAWLEDLASGGKLERDAAEEKLAGGPLPPRPREEPADPARVAAWRSLIKVAERLKHFDGCAASKIEGQPCRTADMRWCGRELARCMRALWTEPEREGIAWAEVGERMRAVLAPHKPVEPMRERLIIEIENSYYEATPMGDGLVSMHAGSATEWTHVCAFRSAVGRTFVSKPSKPAGTVNGKPVAFVEIGAPDVDHDRGVATFVLRWVEWKEPQAPRCGKTDDLGRACTLAAGHAHPNDHSGKPGPYSSETFAEAARRHYSAQAEAEAERLRAKEAADHAAWLRENAAGVVLPEHPAVALLRKLEWSGEDGCPSCWQGWYEEGREHAAGCALATILAGSKPSDRALSDLLAEERAKGVAEERKRQQDGMAVHEARLWDAGYRKGAADEREGNEALLLVLRDDPLVRHTDAREVLRQAAGQVKARGQS